MLDKLIQRFNHRGEVAILKADRELIDGFCKHLQTNNIKFSFVNTRQRMFFAKN
jgi:hypothetical protein